MSQALLKIGELATAAGVSTRTVDYYTSLGLLTPADRTPSNYRLYDPAAIERIATVRQLEAHGVPLDDIATALRAGRTDLTGIIGQLGDDLQALQSAAQAAGPEAHGLLAAITTRAQSMIATALDIAAAIPPI